MEANVRAAWQIHAATRLSARLRSGSAHAAQVSAELAGRFHEAGNISALQLAREQAAASSALIALRAQEAQVTAARGRLLALMGVKDAPDLELLDRLLLPVALDADLETLQAIALEQRLDLQALRTQVKWSEGNEAFTQRWRWINGVGIEVTREHDVDGSTLKGGGVSMEIPVFNSGWGRKQRAMAVRESAEATLRAAELDVSSEINARYAVLRAAEQNVAEYRDRLLPLQQRIVELTQQRQNFMLIGAFELIETRRQDIEAWQGFVASLREYATARSDLARALGGTLPASAVPAEAVSLPDLAALKNTGEAR
jgi:cobalt-zinc-cadmium efflux system outer membrane protein